MESIQLPLLLGMLLAGTGVAMASSGSLNEFRPKVLPVLVQVNAQGKVTNASPATELSPRLNRLLRQNLDELISKPATEHGRPVASQFIANLALRATPRQEGDYDVQFAYVSSSPVPPGSWYWVHIDGHRLALASQGSFNREVRLRYGDHRDMSRNWNSQGYRSTPMPAIQNTMRNAPAAAPARAPAPGH
ncbi:hypothetical protein IMW82_00090 [Rhodanobacter sp. B2A1Ga4]|uniref:hypothetical protein n=1 Tax=Rhodanobacter sp. B2A1Ga4 TaxID=2778647 RepID=UPI001B37A673|nr:hypothetical protein [Rhodanobacter sp. B2A1Ga4]MBQ4853081.1 hypothetical protein [Rhodanobacter sp. B2A1Ga4]